VHLPHLASLLKCLQACLHKSMIVRSCFSQGTLPAYLAAVIIGRDVFLVGASLAARAKALGWNRVSAADFFRIASDSKQVGTAESFICTAPQWYRPFAMQIHGGNQDGAQYKLLNELVLIVAGAWSC